MATLEALKQALIKADEQENFGDAKRLSAAIKEMPEFKVEKAEIKLKTIQSQPKDKGFFDSFKDISEQGKAAFKLSKAQEELRDIQEKEEGIGAGKYALETLKAAGGELKGLGKGALGVGKFVLGPRGEETPFLDVISGVVKDPKRALKGVQTGIGESLKDVGRSFAYEEGRFDPDIFKKKFKEKPLQTALDVIPGIGVGLKAGKGIYKGLKGIVRPTPKIAPKITPKIKAYKETLEETGKTLVKTPKQELKDISKTLLKIDPKNVNNPNYGKSVGKEIGDLIEQINKRDKTRMKAAIRKVRNNPIDSEKLNQNLLSSFEKSGLVDETGVLIPELNKPYLTKQIKALQEGKVNNVGDIKQYMDALDDKINWNNPTEFDEGLKILRREYRGVLTKASPEYDKIAKLVHDKLDDFKPFIKKVDKLGGGEIFGKTGGFKTKQEYDRFIEFLNKHPDKVAGKIKAKTEILNALNKWDQVTSPISQLTGMPLRGTAGQISQLSKLYPSKMIKRKGLKLGALSEKYTGLTGLPKVTMPGKKSGILTRAMLEAMEKEN